MEFFNRVYDLLVSIGGATESMRDSFIYHHARDKFPCDEFRFMGTLGFGGKYYRRENRVSCYREDETPLRRQIIERLNAELKKISPQST
jgi:hypothetical protein